jgi:DNA-binding response OmpR family regulator
MRVAALDDDPDQAELVKRTMVAIGHDCHVFDNGRALLRTLRRETFDLLILDWQLPDINGPEVARWARDNLEQRLPILFVTSRREERDIVEGLAAGADDFMVKPMRIGELVARVRALLRRAYPPQQETEYTWGPYRFDASVGALDVEGERVELKQKEFALALFLFQNLGRLLSRQHLQEAVWSTEVETASRSLDTHISRLRGKLGLRPERGYKLSAVYNLGYRLEAVTSQEA